MKKFDAIFFVALALTAVVSICAVDASSATQTMTEPKETVCQPVTAPTAGETEDPTQGHAETEPPVTETTPPVVLYNVPLEADLQLHIISEAEAHGIDPAIIFAMAKWESSFNPSAVGDGGDSLGLLQIQPRWHQGRMDRLGCPDLFDPFQNVTVCIDYLSDLLVSYNGDIAKALVGYNQGGYKGTITKYAQRVIETAEELRGETYEHS